MTQKTSLSLGFRVGKTRGGGQLFFWRVFFGSYNDLMATSLLKSDARQDLVERFVCTSSFHGRILSCIGTSPPSWAIFPFMGTSSSLSAHLSFHMHIFSSRAHRPFDEHIFPWMDTFPFMKFFRVWVASCPAWARNHLHATGGGKNTEGGNLRACPKP